MSDRSELTKSRHYFAEPPTAHPLPQPNLDALTKPTPGKWPIKIVPGNYRGTFMLIFNNKRTVQVYDTSKPFYLIPGDWQFDVAGIGGSAFAFVVTPEGNVTVNKAGSACAHAEGNALVLHSTPVMVDVDVLGSGGNACEMAVYPAAHFSLVKENTLFHLVPGLTYQFEGGARVGKSAFAFQVGGDGTVRHWPGKPPATPSGPSMHGGPHLLKLRVGWMDIVPESPTVKYRVGASIEYDGPKRVPVILGLVTHLRVGKTAAELFTVGTTPAAIQLTVDSKRFTLTGPWE